MKHSLANNKPLTIWISCYVYPFIRHVFHSLSDFLSGSFIVLSFFFILMAPVNSNASFKGLDLSTDESFLDVSQAFQFSHEIKNELVDISLTIAPNYYLYKNKIRVTVEHPELLENEVHINLPDGELHFDEYFGQQSIFRNHLGFVIDLEHVSQLLSRASMSPKDVYAQPVMVRISYQGCADKGLCYPPQTKMIKMDLAEFLLKHQMVDESVELPRHNNLNRSEKSDLAQVESNSFTGTSFVDFNLEELLLNDNLWFLAFIFFLLGLGLSFTPCVFPMYPILTGLIVGQGDKLSIKSAFVLSFVYVQGMALTYTALGIVVAFAGLQFQALFQHPVILALISVFFIFLALSMFGVFNLALPSAWQAKINSLNNMQKGGSIIGVLLMGIISGLVASPCTTAPLTAVLIYIAQSGDVFIGALALYALSIGMGLPLILLGCSGGRLLPKAGAWMNIVKSIFGFLLLIVPILLLQRILDGFYVEVLWTLLLLSFATYLFVINKRGRSDFWFGFRSLLILFIVFSTGLYNVSFMIPELLSDTRQKNITTAEQFIQVKNLIDLQEKITAASMQKKPVIIDLYADWCIACKEFEKYTFSDVKVQTLFANAVLLKVDLTDSGLKENLEVMAHFNVTGLPSILLFNKQGQELVKHRITGYLKAGPFSQHLQKYLYQ